MAWYMHIPGIDLLGRERQRPPYRTQPRLMGDAHGQVASSCSLLDRPRLSETYGGGLGCLLRLALR